MLRIIIFLFFISTYAQRADLHVGLIPEALKTNANSVIREQVIDINISSRRSLTIKKRRIVTVFNKLGLGDIRAMEGRNIRDIGAVIYDASGKEIKKLRRKDFKEESASGESIISDNRVTYLDYTPTEYPFTIVYESEVSDSNTAFIPPWRPMDDWLISVEKTQMNVTCAADLGFKYKEDHFDKLPIVKKEIPNGVSYSAAQIPAIKSEQYAPALPKFMPTVLLGIDKFHLEGVDGDATSWKNFGLWNYTNLLTGTDELPEETIAKIKSLVGNEKDPMKISKIVYEFVQSKTRYVSIALGIGGWKPMLAKDVDRLGYGDCKALTNYTRVLLAAVGVQSFYTIVISDDNKLDMREDFVSMQGNHIVLTLPDGDKLRWLECTSQTAPFGYLSNSIDDRNVLMVCPDGGKMVKTACFSDAENLQQSNGQYQIDDEGKLTGNVTIKSKGSQYNNKLFLEHKDSKEKDLLYKEYLSNIQNLQLTQSKVLNDRPNLEFIEQLSVSGEKYGNIEAGKIIFPVNAFNNQGHVPQRYRTRTNPFEIERGYLDYDEITVELPAGFAIEALPSAVSLKTKFGEYTAEITEVSTTKLLYKRKLQITKGYHESAEYENYRKFREQVARNDNSKIVLTKS